ncbi:hypothetical protein Mal15_67790 [Stieleria maiorica]|uniref:Cell division protein FtsQ n=1 Tax=Stieleria maiorica TaxID=2795974 RepID=A0A5B9MUC5_9BACT|nr:hypothetical protein [Stieleria maiorica]QEG02658.1 hypothetical protein Mal15_67790 [Stieleria maiorica]
MAKQSEQTDHRPIRRLLRRLIAAPAAWSLAWPMLLLVGSYVAYSRWYADHFATHYRSLDRQSITISPPHEFVRTDLVAEVYDSTRLMDLSPADRSVTAKLASAFASHPWVQHVHRVQKLPAGKFELDLDYRQPVAAFHVTGGEAWKQMIAEHLKSLGYPVSDVNGYLPLDGEGMLLPTAGLTYDDAMELIHIEVWELYPTGNEGTPFGDRRVESAALLAKLLAAVRDQIRIAKITVSGDPRMNLVPKLEIITGDNTHLFWGSPPGMEQPRERDARAKLTDLLSGNYVPGGDLSIAREATPPLR